MTNSKKKTGRRNFFICSALFALAVAMSVQYGILSLVTVAALVCLWLWLYTSIWRELKLSSRDSLHVANAVIAVCALFSAIAFSLHGSVLVAMSAIAANMVWWLAVLSSLGVFFAFIIPSLLTAFAVTVLLSVLAIIVAFGWELLNPNDD